MLPMLRRRPYAELCRRFRWDLPERLNLAEQVLDGWSATDPDRIALIDLSQGARRDWTYGQLWRLSRRVEAALIDKGVLRGDRVAVLLGQEPLTVAAHAAIWRLGAISAPLSVRLPRAALRARLDEVGAGVVVSDAAGRARLEGAGCAVISLRDLPEGAGASSAGVETGPDDAAVLLYTSGTGGAARGVLHGHRVLTGHLPGVELSHDFLGQRGDVLWTPADWAWIAGLFQVVMPGLALGVPVVAAPVRPLEAEACLRVLRDAGVRNAFLPPVTLRLLRGAGAALTGLRSIATGGDAAEPELCAWLRETSGAAVSETYGLTECNMLAAPPPLPGPPGSDPSEPEAPGPGTVGPALPGLHLAVLGPDGMPGADGAEGEIAVRRGSPAMMLEYWRRPEETARAFAGRWMRTGDRGRLDDGRLTVLGRCHDGPDLPGGRLAPARIEARLRAHPAVADAGAVAEPGAEAGAGAVRVCVVPGQGAAPDAALAAALAGWLAEGLPLAAEAVTVAFVARLPRTPNGQLIRSALRGEGCG
ncbi:AMP-binding protein [Roseivivax sp. CAU 1761]